MACRIRWDVFAGAITIMGGVPSICLLPEVMPNADFEAYLDQFFQEIGSGDRLILGISDTAPPSADFERMLRIGDRGLGSGAREAAP